MLKVINVLLLSAIFVTGCGGGGEDNNGSTPAASNPEAPVLSSIGNKTVITGSSINFTVNATDPNGLSLSYSTDGSVGAGLNPYSETASLAGFNASPGSRQFTWDTTGVALGDYFIEFSAMNSASLSHSETIRVRIESTPPPQTQFETGQTLYNADCRNSGCHHDEDNNNPIGVFTVLCSTEADVKFASETGPGSMPTFNYNSIQEAAISYYLNNVRSAECNTP